MVLRASECCLTMRNQKTTTSRTMRNRSSKTLLKMLFPGIGSPSLPLEHDDDHLTIAALTRIARLRATATTTRLFAGACV